MFSEPVSLVLYCYGIYQKYYDKMEVSNLELHEGLPDLEKVQSLNDGKFHVIVIDDLMEYIVKSVETQNLFTKYCHHYNIMAIFLTQNVPIEKWEKLGIKEPVKEVSVETLPLKDQSFQKKAISQVKNQQGQGIQKKIIIPQKFPQLSLIKKNKGVELLKLLRKNDNIKLNKKGEICYKGKLLKKSNVYDLINHAIHTNKSHPTHMKNFYKIFAKILIPNKLIKNKEGRNIMNKEIHHIDTRWRPPGRLN